MKLEEVIHYYLGCEVMVDLPDEKDELTGEYPFREPVELISVLRNGYAYVGIWEEPVELFKIKPILRKLSSMTEEEKDKLFDEIWPSGLFGILWRGKIEFIDWFIDTPDSEPSDLNDDVMQQLSIKNITTAINWIRKNGFDCDGLIDSGLAIDSETTKQ